MPFREEHLLATTIDILLACLGIGIIIFSVYLIPFLFFNVDYDVPQFVVNLKYYLQTHQGLSDYLVGAAIFTPMLVSIGVIFYTARRIEGRIEPEVEEDLEEEQTEFTITQSELFKADQIRHAAEEEAEKNAPKPGLPPTAEPGALKDVLLFIGIIVVLIAIVEYLIYIDLL